MVNTKKSSAVSIRSYNVGLGDCFLLSFPDDGTTRHILIDFGNAPGQTKESFNAIAENIRNVTDGHLDVVIVSNDHHDHVSGFLNQKVVFDDDKFKVDAVWMAFPNQPKFYERHAKTLMRARKQVGEFLDKRKDSKMSESFTTLIRNSQPSTDELNYIRNLPDQKDKVQYLHRRSPVKSPFGSKFHVDVLGPEKDVSPYYVNKDFDFWDEISDLGSIAVRLESGLDEKHKKKHPLICRPGFKNATCTDRSPQNLSGRDWQILKKINETFGVAEMRAIDGVINNLSLVLLLTINGKTLLFPGDADEASWENVLDDYALNYCDYHQEYEEEPNCENCLKRRKAMKSIDFLKLAQHGSKAGTPAELLKRLNPNVKIMVSTKKNVYGAKNPIPDTGFLEKLEEKYGKKNLIVTNEDKLWEDVILD